MATTNNETQEIEELKKEILRLRTGFNIEKNAKNEAYAFILSNELFKPFSDFCKNNRNKDPHSLCLSALQTDKELQPDNKPLTRSQVLLLQVMKKREEERKKSN